MFVGIKSSAAALSFLYNHGYSFMTNGTLLPARRILC